ncbi:hypothetical protein FDP41_003772 [Naegleria fowleri]|uniref:Complex 1 LYR protein domain-containing protein n=1 Tax=Naegleria fowleri TaxID=5763 RepID=A0A6A5BW16_NAEFO|nr:uncharacterized protein FDP41_003772 [Naegleria fowleri]KAF0977119.1 hypothetical protein FDP41_003772 [Naegleria fowleri]
MNLSAFNNNSKFSILSLYRNLLRNMKYYPSVRKEGMIQAIREEFRAYKHEKDPKKIEMKIGEARGGLERLKAYAEMSKAQNKGGRSTFSV